MIKSQLFGYSLLELSLSLVISAILFMLAIPAFQDFTQGEKTQTTVNQLVNLLHYARLQAIETRTPVIFCASLDHKICNPDWLGDFIVFINENGHGTVAHKKDLLRIWHLPADQGTIRWQAKQTHLTLQPTGISPSNAGKFYYCPANHNLDHARAIIINFTGRLAIADKQTEPKLNCPY